MTNMSLMRRAELHVSETGAECWSRTTTDHHSSTQSSAQLLCPVCESWGEKPVPHVTSIIRYWHFTTHTPLLTTIFRDVKQEELGTWTVTSRCEFETKITQVILNSDKQFEHLDFNLLAKCSCSVQAVCEGKNIFQLLVKCKVSEGDFQRMKDHQSNTLCVIPRTMLSINCLSDRSVGFGLEFQQTSETVKHKHFYPS